MMCSIMGEEEAYWFWNQKFWGQGYLQQRKKGYLDKISLFLSIYFSMFDPQ
jgi:hypothetical protein